MLIWKVKLVLVKAFDGAFDKHISLFSQKRKFFAYHTEGSSTSLWTNIFSLSDPNGRLLWLSLPDWIDLKGISFSLIIFQSPNGRSSTTSNNRTSWWDFWWYDDTKDDIIPFLSLLPPYGIITDFPLGQKIRLVQSFSEEVRSFSKGTWSK